MAEAQQSVHKGVIQSVLSGDCVVVRGVPRGGPPPTRTVALSNITAPRPGRRPMGQDKEVKDEPYAWESLQFLRNKLVGNSVSFVIDYCGPNGGREYGSIFLEKGTAREENIVNTIVMEGMAKVRDNAREGDIETLKKLEASAQAAGKGVWASDAESHVRSINWVISDPRAFVEQRNYKAIDAVIEHVRDGCTVRAMLKDKHDYVTVMLAGIKTPIFKRGQDGNEVAEPHAAEAKYFTESRLLNRDVKIILEGTSGNNFLGTVIHPAGNISQILLASGYAKIVDWSFGVVTQSREEMRAAEKTAKDKRLRVWASFVPNAAASMPEGERTFSAQVTEIVNAETVIVRVGEESKRINLSSVRQPRIEKPKVEKAAEGEEGEKAAEVKAPAPRRGNRMWDTPNAFEAREFLRKKLIGKKVEVHVDYIKPANEGYAAKTCATVRIGGVNIAVSLISKGLAKCLRHRQDDDSRSSCYDDLLTAETKAKKSGKGVWSEKETPLNRVTNVMGKEMAERFFPSMQRSGKVTGVIEYVANAGRVRVYVPKETALITFAFAGISCPRPGRKDRTTGEVTPDEPFSKEGIEFTRRLCMQHEVEISCQATDRTGCFIGHIWVDGENVAEKLVAEGMAKMHFTADRYSNYSQLSQREAEAKAARKGVWADYKEPTAEELAAAVASTNITERKTNHVAVIVSDIESATSLWAQPAASAEALTALMAEIAAHFAANAPSEGHTPRKGDTVAAKFSADNAWYRALVTKVAGDEIDIRYIDYGNSETVGPDAIAPLPAAMAALDAQASLHNIAFVSDPLRTTAVTPRNC